MRTGSGALSLRRSNGRTGPYDSYRATLPWHGKMTSDRPSRMVHETLLLERTAGDKELLMELIDIFMESCPLMLEEIRESVGTKDSGRLHKAAHRLKGSMSNFGAEPAVKAAHKLEMIGRNGESSGAEEAFTELESRLADLRTDLEWVKRRIQV